MNQNYASSPTSPTSLHPPHPDSGTVREDTHPQGDRYLHAPLRQDDSAKCGKAEWSHCGIAGVQKTGNGNKMLSIQPQPVSEKLRDIAESFGDMAENREMNYCLDIAPELTWNTDLSCFNKIAGNLISNAFKYTPDKGNISVTLYTKNERLILKIANTGKGITPENLGKIFDRYKILDSVEMNGKNSRNGLGLAICKTW